VRWDRELLIFELDTIRVKRQRAIHILKCYRYMDEGLPADRTKKRPGSLTSWVQDTEGIRKPPSYTDRIQEGWEIGEGGAWEGRRDA